MKGFIQRRGAGWQLRVYLGRDPITGKQRYASKTVRGGKREAQRALAEFVTDAQRGRLGRSSATVGELLEAWFARASRDFSPKTVVETRGFIDRNLMPSLGVVALSKLRASDLDRFYAELCDRGGRDGSPLSPATVRRIHGILRRALQQAVKWRWIDDNPAANASPPRVPAAELRPPSPEQVSRVIAAVEADPAFALYVRLAALSGARRSELVALRWGDVDLNERSVVIRRASVAGPHGLVEKDTKTHAVRRVAIDDSTVEHLRNYRSGLRDRSLLVGVEVTPDCLVFHSDVEMQVPWYPDSVSRRFRKACESVGVRGVRLHDLRHYVATTLLAAGVDVRTIAGRLGHRNAATTLNVYSHFVPEADRQAAELLSNLH